MTKPSRRFIFAALFFCVVLPLVVALGEMLSLDAIKGVSLLLYVAPANLVLMPFALIGFVSYEQNLFFDGFVKILPIFPQGYILCSATWLGLLLLVRVLFFKASKSEPNVAEQGVDPNA